MGAHFDLGQDNGYDLVLFKESSIDFSAVDPKELGTAMYSRKVLWAAEDLDLTEQVAGKNALQEAAAILAERMLPKIVK